MSGKHEKHYIFPHPRADVREWDSDGYPAVILVTMSNNTVEEYVRKRPNKAFEAAMKSLEKFSVNFKNK